MPPLVIAAGIAAIGGIGASVAGGLIAKGGAEDQAKAQEKAGLAQAKAAQDQLNFAKQSRQESIAYAKQYGGLQPGEIASINKMLSDKESSLTQMASSIQKQQTYLDSLDPQVKAAGKNLYDLLSGKQADMLKPVLEQRQFQRTQLQNDLAARLGPGFSTSSAGMEALNRFDQETNMNTAQVQQQATQLAGGIYSNLYGEQFSGASDISSKTQGAAQFGQLVDSTAVQAEQYGATRFNNTLQAASNPSGVLDAGKSVIGSAGLPFGGDFTRGQATGQLGGALGGLGGQIAGASFGALFNSGGGGGGTNDTGTNTAYGNPYSSYSAGNVLASNNNYQMPQIQAPSFGSMYGGR